MMRNLSMAAALLLTLSFCGKPGGESADAGRTDAQAAMDAGAPLDAAVDRSDAGAADADVAVDAGPHSCAAMTAPVGRSLTVHYGPDTLDFSSGRFEVTVDTMSTSFFFYSLDDQYRLEVAVWDSASGQCPQAAPLPTIEADYDIWLERADGTVLAVSAQYGATGTLTIDGYNVDVGSRELSFSCENCNLPASLSLSSDAGQPLPAIITGAARTHE